MKEDKYNRSLKSNQGKFFKAVGRVFVPLAYGISLSDNYVFAADPFDLHFGEVQLLMRPGVTKDNGAEWAAEQQVQLLARTQNYMNELTALDVRRGCMALDKATRLALFHKLDKHYQNIALGNIFARLAYSFHSYVLYPYRVRISGTDDTYYEKHFMSFDEAKSYIEYLETNLAWSIPYQLGTKELEHGWSANQ